jgi:hypothetical protein
MGYLKKLCFILSLGSCPLCLGYDNNLDAENDARSAIFQATYKQSGMEDGVSAFAERQVPESYKPVITKIVIFGKIIIQKKAEFKWTF